MLASVLGFGPIAVTSQAASLEVDFQATIASEQHPSYAGEAQFYHVSMNPANPGTGSFAATIVGTNNPAPRFVRNFDGPVVAYKFAGGTDNVITAVAQSGGTAEIITFTTTDTVFDGFAQQQAKIWTTTDPGYDIKVAGSNPYGEADDIPGAGGTGGWRSLSDATGKINVSALASGSVHIYYGAFNATPSVSLVMRDTAAVDPAPDITITNAHLNGDTADRTEYYLAEIDFVTDGVYDEIEFVWNAGSANGRGIAVVVTGPAPADLVAPTLAPANITNSSGGPITDVTPLVYTVPYSELMDPETINADDFEIIGTASATVSSVVRLGSVTLVNVALAPGTSGAIQLQVKAGAVITDLAGNPLDTTSAIIDPEIVTVLGDDTAPTVVSVNSPPAGGTIYGTLTVPYTVTFSEYVSPLDASDFTSTGTAPFTIGAVTDISPGFPAPSVYTVQVIPSGAGTLQLQVNATVEDPSGNPLAAPVTDSDVYTFTTATEPARETVTLDASTTSDATTSTHTLVFDASASDKLVVVVTGENGNPGSLAGQVNTLTYDGVSLTKAVGRLPIGTSPSGLADQLYNDIWYLDNPAAATALADVNDADPLTAGNISASVNSRGVITAIRLSGTAPGVGVTAISAQEVKSLSVIAGTSGGMVIASLGMGGDGNTANVTIVNTDPALAELTAVSQGSNWDGHVTARTSVVSPALVTTTFVGGSTVGTHTIAAEFLGALVSASSPYDTWASVNATSGNPDDDFDGDGVSNAVEFVLGGLATTNDLGKLPVLATNGTNTTFTFMRDQESIDPKTTLTIELSTDLAAWDTLSSPYAVPDGSTGGVVSPGVTVVKDSPVAGTDTVTLTVPQAPDAKKFARLKVVITP